MIFDLLTANQWFVVYFVTWIVLATVIEVLMAFGHPYEYRGPVDPPPILGGLVFGLVGTFAIAAILGIVHGLAWLWQN